MTIPFSGFRKIIHIKDQEVPFHHVFLHRAVLLQSPLLLSDLKNELDGQTLTTSLHYPHIKALRYPKSHHKINLFHHSRRFHSHQHPIFFQRHYIFDSMKHNNTAFHFTRELPLFYSNGGSSTNFCVSHILIKSFSCCFTHS